MTGPVTYEQLYAFLSLFAAAGGVVAGFLAWVFRMVSALKRAYAADRDRMQLQIETCEKDVAAYKIHVAETFATKEGVSAAVGRVESAVDRLTGRIDRLLEAQAHPQPTTRRSGG